MSRRGWKISALRSPRRKSERLEDLINEFLEIARYSLSTITLQHSEINLTRLLEQFVYEFQPVLDQKGLTCRLAVGEDIILENPYK